MPQSEFELPPLSEEDREKLIGKFPTFHAKIKEDGTISAERVDKTETQKPFQADNDMGPLGIGLTVIEDRVVIMFDRPITALALTAAEARKLGNGFLDRARQAK